MRWSRFQSSEAADRAGAGRRVPLVVGPAALDVIGQRVLVEGFVVHLPIRDVMILEVLMRAAGQVVSANELRGAIGHQRAGDDDVARWVRCLARRLAVSPLLAPLIECVGPAGYRYPCTKLRINDAVGER